MKRLEKEKEKEEEWIEEDGESIEKVKNRMVEMKEGGDMKV